jgi:photosystem II stability/assembly factor-like uncharacterized protein
MQSTMTALPDPGTRRGLAHRTVETGGEAVNGPSAGDLQPGRPTGDYRGISAVFARLRSASAFALLTAVLALGAAPSLSAQSPLPSSWVLDYVNFVTRSDGWAMATSDATSNSSAELLTSHDGGRHWHDVTPPAVLAAENAETDNPDSTGPDLTPFILSGRHAWLAVGRSDPQSSELELFTTSDAGRRWVLRGRFAGAELTGISFLSPSTGFISTQVGYLTSKDLAQIYATSDGGRHWREVSVMNDSCQGVGGLSFASPRVGFLSGYCGFGGPGLLRTSDGGRRWGYVPIPAFDSDNGGVYPPVFSSPRLGSMVVEMLPVLRIATTTDAGRHWDLRRLAAPAARLIRSANFYCPQDVSCLDLVSARTWLVGAGQDLYTTTDAGLSWRASPAAPNTPWGRRFNQLSLDFLSPGVGWAWYVGGSDLLWRTTDAGRHWSTYSLGAP